MRTIELDASQWTNVLDFCLALKGALGSCEGHGNSPDAFIDSMVWGGMNSVEPPYKVRIIGSQNTSREVREYIGLMANAIKEGREWKLANLGIDTEVGIEVAGSDLREDRSDT